MAEKGSFGRPAISLMRPFRSTISLTSFVVLSVSTTAANSANPARLGVVDDRGLPIKKPWRLMTTSPGIVEALQGISCNHKPEEHGEARGKALERTGFYTQAMCELIAKAINPRVGTTMVPAFQQP